MFAKTADVGFIAFTGNAVEYGFLANCLSPNIDMPDKQKCLSPVPV